MTLRAVDISHVKAITDWDALCRWADILIFKATEGPDFADSAFTSRLAEARRRGKLIGYYHYVGWSELQGRPARVFDPVVEADWFARHFTHQPGEVPIADWEPYRPPADPDGWLATFLLRLVTAHGCPVGMTYMNTSAAASSPWTRTRAVNTALWIARYYANDGRVPSTPPSPGSFGGYAMWQYTSNGAVPGVLGAVDVSLFYGTPAQWRAIGGAGKPTPPPTPPAPPILMEDDMERLVDPNGTVWLWSAADLTPISDTTLSGLVGDLNGGAAPRPVTWAQLDAVKAYETDRVDRALKGTQNYILGHQPAETEKPYLWDRIVALGDAIKALQSGGVDPAVVVTGVLSGLNGAQLNVQQATGQ